MTDATRTQTTTPDAADRASATETQPVSNTCCGGPAPPGTDACCAHDAEAKSTRGTGCGCGSAPAPAVAKGTACCASR